MKDKRKPNLSGSITLVVIFLLCPRGQMQKEREETKGAVADIAKTLQVLLQNKINLATLQFNYSSIPCQDQMDGNVKDLLDVVKREKVREGSQKGEAFN